jgi:hypothetical protein
MLQLEEKKGENHRLVTNEIRQLYLAPWIIPTFGPLPLNKIYNGPNCLLDSIRQSMVSPLYFNLLCTSQRST